MEGTQINHGIAQIALKMIKIVFFLHLPTNKNFQSKIIRNKKLCIVILVMDQLLDMDMIFILVMILTYLMTIYQIYQVMNNLKLRE